MIALENVSKKYAGISYNGDSGIYLWIKNIISLTSNRAPSILAVNNISFSVGKGEIFGIYGSNGAGKTTLIKLLSGLLLPSTGVVNVNGCTELKHIKNMVSYISTNGWMGLEWQLTAKENMIIYGNMFGLTGKALERKCDDVLLSLGMADDKDKLTSQLSAGMRQKITIARGLILDRPIIFYDEPSVSLDVPSAKGLRALIQADAKENHRTVIIASHNEEDLSVCDRIMFLSKGALLAVGTPEELMEPLGSTVIVDIKCAGFEHEAALFLFAGVENMTCSIMPGERDYKNVKLRVRRDEFSPDAMIDFYIENNIVMLGMKLQEPSLADIHEYYIRLKESEVYHAAG